MNQFEAVLAGYRHVELLWGDTLQRLADRELGDAAKWVDIANLNGLAPPYVTGDPALESARCALYGKLLLVPASSSAVTVNLNPDLVFERDVALTNKRLTATNGDFTMVAGVGNLSQAMRHRIDTAKHDLLFHPQYGCDIHSLKGKTGNPTRNLLAAEYVRCALRSDPRVKDVPRASAEISGDAIRVDAVVVPITQRQLNFGGVF